MTIADSDVLIDALRGHEPIRGLVDRYLEHDSMATTAITVFELLSGAHSIKQKDKVERLLSALTVFAFDDRAAACSASIRLTLDNRGQPIGMADYLIAGFCVSRGLPLLTRIRRHFERVPGLVLCDF